MERSKISPSWPSKILFKDMNKKAMNKNNRGCFKIIIRKFKFLFLSVDAARNVTWIYILGLLKNSWTSYFYKGDMNNTKKKAWRKTK